MITFVNNKNSTWSNSVVFLFDANLVYASAGKNKVIRERLCDKLPAWDPPEGISFRHEIMWKISRQRISLEKEIPSGGSQAGNESPTSRPKGEARGLMLLILLFIIYITYNSSYL